MHKSIASKTFQEQLTNAVAVLSFFLKFRRKTPGIFAKNFSPSPYEVHVLLFTYALLERHFFEGRFDDTAIKL